ncbi:TetR/AcrR family transcriptional regulator [Schumannella luteola]
MDDQHRTPLNRARVLEAAISLADEVGLDALSMRSLSARLGVVPMALYKHVADKDDLVAGILDTVVAQYAQPDPQLGWRASVRYRVHAARAALARHPWLRSGILQASRPTPAVLAHMDAVAGDLARGGFSYDLIHYGMHALGHRVWGFAPEAFSPAPGAAPLPPPDPAQAQALAVAFPHVAAIAADSAARNPQGACDDDGEFDFGLELLLDALERLHSAGWVSR